MGLSLNSVARLYGDHTIFEHVSLDLGAGERLALIGENGSGKSTLLRVMAGLEAPDAGSVTVTAAVALLTQFSETPQGTLTQAVTLPALLAAQRAFDQSLAELGSGSESSAQHFAQAEEALRLAGGYDFPARAATVLAGLNLDPDGSAHALSGGQMRRLMLARLLLSPAGVYLLDEPTNHLDARSVRWLEGWIAAQPASFVLASHDRAFLDAVSTRTAELERGHLSVFPGPYTQAMQIKAELRAAQGRQYEAGRRQRSALKDEAERRQSKARSANSYNPKRASDGDKMLAKGKAQRAQNVNSSRAKALEQRLERLVTADKPFDDRRTLHLELPPTPPGPGEVLSLRNLGVKRGERQVISGLNLELRRGERLALQGPNGSGKSTLLAAIRGALAHTGERRLGAGLLLAWTGQNHEELVGLDRVQDALLDANPLLTPHQLHELAASVGLEGGPSQRVDTLSGGQLTRLSFARLSVVRAQLLLLDEPTNHLDVRAIEALEALLLRFPGTLILASHDRRLMGAVATRTLELETA
jgi:ATPase subunit of ABC transporter with duplicated ATPase domains